MANARNAMEAESAMDGLWTAEFGSSVGVFSGGVAVFRSGKLMGGDGSYYYIGEYKLEGNMFRAVVKVSPFIAGAESVFKTVGQELTLELAGRLTNDGSAIAQGHARGMPNVNIGVRLTKRA